MSAEARAMNMATYVPVDVYCAEHGLDRDAFMWICSEAIGGLVTHTYRRADGYRLQLTVNGKRVSHCVDRCL